MHRGALDQQDKWGFTAAMRTCQNGHVPALLLLMRKNGHVPALLLLMRKNGHVPALLLLMREGASCIMMDHEGHSALHWAVHHGEHTAADWLLKEGAVRASVDQQDSQGAAALHLSAKRRGREMCRPSVGT
ncbi:ankyrin repeat-containing domain protein [Baffinella frigidus]|nr:ankyrin repeat-containing domain protein [Cryptophyta sp. CCMP2293]